MKQITEQDIEALKLTPKEIVDALKKEFEDYGRGKSVNDPSTTSKRENTLIITTKAHDDSYKLDKRIEERWEDDKKTGRKTTVTFSDTAGKEIFVYEGDTITNYRTGAAAALTAWYLMPNIPPNERVVSIVGTGAVASEAVKSIDYLLSPRTIRFATTNPDSKERFSRYIRSINPTVNIEGYIIYKNKKELDNNEVKQFLSGSHVLVIAQRLGQPLPYDLISKMHPSRHISAMSGDGEQHNFDKRVLLDSWMVFDTEQKARITAEIRHLSDAEYGKIKRIGTVGDLALGKGELYRDKPTFYDSSGMGVSDLAIAKLIALLMRFT